MDKTIEKGIVLGILAKLQTEHPEAQAVLAKAKKRVVEWKGVPPEIQDIFNEFDHLFGMEPSDSSPLNPQDPLAVPEDDESHCVVCGTSEPLHDNKACFATCFWNTYMTILLKADTDESDHDAASRALRSVENGMAKLHEYWRSNALL